MTWSQEYNFLYAAGIPHPQVIALIGESGVQPTVPPEKRPVPPLKTKRQETAYENWLRSASREWQMGHLQLQGSR